MSAEAASHHQESEDHHTRPHLHIVENNGEHGPEEGADIMIGFEPEVRRDHVAIQKFIKTRNELLAKGVSFADAILDAARSYDETLSIDAEHWRPKVVDGITDFNPGITSGNYNLKGGVTLLETAPSEALVSAVSKARNKATQTVRDHYEALRQAGHNTFVERNAEAEEIQVVNDKYKDPTSSAAHTVVETEDYIQANGETGQSKIEDRDIHVKDQLDYADAAIEASYKVRQEALAAGKTIDQAYDLGAAEYNRVMDAAGNKTTAAGRREAAAIIAFNEARDKFVSHDLRNKKYDHAKALHGAVTNYVETLEHVEHLGHENPDSIFADGHHEVHDGDEHQAHEEHAAESPTKEKGRIKSLGKSVFTAMKAFGPSKEGRAESQQNKADIRTEKATIKKIKSEIKALLSEEFPDEEAIQSKRDLLTERFKALQELRAKKTFRQSNRSALLRYPLYKANDAFGNLIADAGRTVGKTGLNNQFIDWRPILKQEAEQHERAKTERKAKEDELVSGIVEPVLRNWNYRGTPQDAYVMPTDWPGNEYETPGHENIMMLTRAQLQNEFGFSIPDNQAEPTLDYLNNKMMEITRGAILEELGEEKLEEFDKLPKAPEDQDDFIDWINSNIPTLRETVEREFDQVLSSEEFAAFREFLDKRVTL